MTSAEWRKPGWRNRFWLWRHDGHAHLNLTGPVWRCSCGATNPPAKGPTMPESQTKNDVLTDEVRDLLRDWWDEDTTSGVESAFPIIHRVIRERMAQAWDEGVGIGSGHAFPDDPCWQWSEEKRAYLADLPNPYRSSDNPSSPGTPTDGATE